MATPHAPSHPAAAPPPPPCSYYTTTEQTPGPPGGPNPGEWQALVCNGTVALTGAIIDGVYEPVLRWVATNPATAPAAAGPAAPAVLAAQAAAQLQLPAPTPGMSPAGTAYVNLPEWLWIDPAIWHAYSVTATAANAVGAATATATATPVDVVWDMGDRPTPDTVCNSPGVPYDEQEPPADQTTTCSHTFVTSSLGQPSPDGNADDAAFPVTVTLQWQVTWTASDGATGTLPTISTITRTTLRVAQIEAVTCTGTCPPPT